MASHVGLPINSFYVRAVWGEAEIRLTAANVIAPLSFFSAAAEIMLAIGELSSPLDPPPSPPACVSA